MKRTVLLGTELDALSLEEAVNRAMAEMKLRRSAYVVTPNAEMLVSARRNPALCEAVNGAALSLPDGIGVLLVSRILGTPISDRVTGIDFAAALMDEMAKKRMRVYLLGAREGVGRAAEQRLCARYPALVIVGVSNGYADLLDEERLISRINASGADLLLVCLGSPKQELWMQRNAPRLQVGLMAGLGGTLDVFAGHVRRAPALWRKSGLEWLYRLIRQPWRIGRVMRIPQLFFAAICTKIGGNRER